MKHLTPEELSAYLDLETTEALAVEPTEALAEVGKHLESCAECRERLAVLRAQDDALFAARAVMPDDAYFESFASRVQQRIAEDGTAMSSQERIDTSRPLEGTPPPHRAPWWSTMFGWLQSPARLAWAGGVAVVIVGAGVAFMTMRETGVPQLRDSAVGLATDQVAEQETAQAPSTEEAEGKRAMASSPNDEVRQDAAQPGRAREMRRTETGEEVPVDRDVPAFAREPVARAPAPSAAGEPTYVQKPQRASPMTGSALTESSASKEKQEMAKLGTLDVSSARVCGQVQDAKNRPLAGVQVVLADRGMTATTDADGRFCFDAPAGAHTLTVMAVGFRTFSQNVETGRTEPLAIKLDAVDVLAQTDKSAASSLSPNTLTGGAKRAIDEDALAIPEDAAIAMREAQRLTTAAERDPTAKNWDAAADAWSKTAALMPAGAVRLDAQYRTAEAAMRAWRTDANDRRRDRARKDVEAYLEVAPEGAERENATGWFKALEAN